MLFIWITIFLFFVVAEMGTPHLFFCLGIALGSLAAAIAHIYGLSCEKQIIIFLIATMISFFLLQLFARSLQSKKFYKTALEQMKGSITCMTSECDNNPGTVHIAGTTWNAQSINKKPIKAGTIVRIIEIKNITLIVEPLTQYGEENV